jgi:hypothetical protein
MKRLLAVLALFAIVGMLLLITACGKTTASVSASTSAAAKGDAKALSKCLPQTPVAQLTLAKSLTSTAGRTKLADSCGIPPQRRAAFEEALLAAGENGHLTTHAGRVTFFEVTVPHLIEVNQ